MDDEKLICLVRHYEELYNTASKKYTDSTHKDKIWTSIGRELNTSGNGCKIRWISLRDQLRKALKKNKAIGKRKKWKYEDSMSFIIPFFREREPESNVSPLNSDDEPNCEDAQQYNDTNDERNWKSEWTNYTSPESPKSPTSNAKKASRSETASTVVMKYLLDTQKRENDASPHPIDAFFNGLAATVKTFSPEYQHLAKSKMFAVVSELEWAQLPNKQLTSSIIPSTSRGDCGEGND